jgi:predicted O-methyltransferase YrrM
MSSDDQKARLANALHLRRQIKNIPPDEIRRMFRYDRTLLPNPYLAEKDKDVDSVEKAVSQTGISPGYPSWNLLYYSLLSSLTPQAVVVEIGTHKGFSTILLAQAIKDRGCEGTVWTVDLDPYLVEIAQQNVAQAGLTAFVQFNVAESAHFLGQFAEKADHIDFAFVDGDHSEPQVMREFELLHPLVAKCGGKIFFDNTGSGGVAEALIRIRREHRGNLVEFANCSWGPHGNVIWQA